MQEVQHRMHFYLWQQQQETGCMNMSHDDDEIVMKLLIEK